MSINKLQVIIINSFSKKEFNFFNKTIRIKLYSDIFLNNCYNFFNYSLFILECFIVQIKTNTKKISRNFVLRSRDKAHVRHIYYYCKIYTFDYIVKNKTLSFARSLLYFNISTAPHFYY